MRTYLQLRKDSRGTVLLTRVESSAVVTLFVGLVTSTIGVVTLVAGAGVKIGASRTDVFFPRLKVEASSTFSAKVTFGFAGFASATACS